MRLKISKPLKKHNRVFINKHSLRFYYLCHVVNLTPGICIKLDLAPYIKELILLHEEVILPGFGCFATRYKPARIRKNTNVIDPPSRELFLDINKDKEDNLLVSHIASKQKISEAKAGEMISRYVEFLHKTIQEKGYVKLEGIGKISKSVSGSMVFEPLAEENYLLDAFGLTSVEIPRIKKHEESFQSIVQPPVKKPEPKVSPEPAPAKKRMLLPIAAIILLLLLIGGGILYFTGVYDRYIKTLIPKSASSPQKEKQQENIIFGKEVPLGEDSLMTAIDKQLSEKSSKEKALYYKEPSLTKPVQPATVEKSVAEAVATQPSLSEEGNYHIISGSFLIPGNADKQKAMLEKKGYSPKIVRKKNEFFYVSLFSYPTREQAVAEMRKLRKELDLPLWILEN